MTEKNSEIPSTILEQEISLPEIPKEAQEKLKKIKDLTEKFKKSLIKEHKDVLIGIALLPPAKILPTDTPEMKEKLKKAINMLVLIKDLISGNKDGFVKRDGINKSIKKIAETIDKKILPNVMDIYELRETCFDGKMEVMETIAAAAPIYDPKDLLSSIKISIVHKNMVLKRFEKYIVSYVCVGSMFRGDATSHDIDVAVIVDDTDVKKMTRVELRDKLGAIIRGMGNDASYLTKVKKQFHIQTYILTDFWESIKDAQPVIYTFLRDGVPVYDRGVFMPWKLLLKMGRIRPSPEAIDMQMNLGQKLIKRTQGKLIGIVGEDLYYAILNPAQAALMLYGIAPPTPKETIKLMDEIFVKKEKLLEVKYVKILEKIRKYYKDIEHGTIKEIKGRDIDDLLNSAQDYLDRLQKLFNEIQKRKDKETINEDYQETINLVKEVLEILEIKYSQNDFMNKFKSQVISKKTLPGFVLENIIKLQDAKTSFIRKKLSSKELDKVKRESRKAKKEMIELIQRKRGKEIERAKIKFKYGDKYGEVLLLDNVAFITEDLTEKNKKIQKGDIDPSGGLTNLIKSDLVELEKHLAQVKIPSNVFIKEKIFEDLRKLFGYDIEIMVSS